MRSASPSLKLVTTLLLALACSHIVAQSITRCPPLQGADDVVSQSSDPLKLSELLGKSSGALKDGLNIFLARANRHDVQWRSTLGVNPVEILRLRSLISRISQPSNSKYNQNSQYADLLDAYKDVDKYLAEELSGTGIFSSTPDSIKNDLLSDRQLLLRSLRSHGFSDLNVLEQARAIAQEEPALLKRFIASLVAECLNGDAEGMARDYDGLLTISNSSTVSNFISENKEAWAWMKGATAEIEQATEKRNTAAKALEASNQAAQERQQAADQKATKSAEEEAARKEQLVRADSIRAAIKLVRPCPCEQSHLDAISAYSYSTLKRSRTQVDANTKRISIYIQEIPKSIASLPENDAVLQLLSPSDLEKFRWSLKQLKLAEDAESRRKEELKEIDRNMSELVSLQENLINRSIAITDSYALFFQTTIPIYEKSAKKAEIETKAELKPLRPKLDASFWAETQRRLTERLDYMPLDKGLAVQSIYDDIKVHE